MSFVHGLKTFLEQQGIPVAPKSIQPKEGTTLFEVSNQKVFASLLNKSISMVQYGCSEKRIYSIYLDEIVRPQTERLRARQK
jgi:hypothetical protein